MVISTALIKELRETSGAGMMDCKKALTENNGNIEEAKDWLRKNGLVKAAKKASRTAAEGLVALATKGTTGVVVELNSETDFVARNDKFQACASTIAQAALAVDGDVEALKAAKFPGSSRNIGDEVSELVGTIGENLNLRRFGKLSVKQGSIVSYIHNAIAPRLGKIGVLVALESSASADKLETIGKQIAMHIAAARPESLNADELDPSLVERERVIFREQAKASGKPDNIIEKMVEGRISKYYGEVVLLEQVFVIDGKTKVSDAVKEAANAAGAPITVTGYLRFELGEGIQKEETDFAAEVAAVANS
ncbi:MAG: translation elongation factor Ts [Rickettsiales bacterium]|jgi:elongation factor Ts|nr:translation elongation factor Ts [Rickettsiales bacterium]